MTLPERLPCLYISGPYRAPTPFRIQANIRAAQEVALAVWRLGAVAICPHANTALFDGEADDAVWLAGDLELVRRCDGMVMVPGWARSVGAQAERDLAISLGLPVFEPDDWGIPTWLIVEWIDAWKINRRAESLGHTADRP
jgi:hypothetical protein